MSETDTKSDAMIQTVLKSRYEVRKHSRRLMKDNKITRTENHAKYLPQNVARINKYCYEWNGAKHKDDYGRIVVNKVQILTHRLSYCIYYNEVIPDNLLVTHLCNNRKCINPLHLKLGTEDDNNRYANQCGRKEGKYTTPEIREQIYVLYRNGYKQSDIARKLHLTRQTVHNQLKKLTT